MIKSDLTRRIFVQNPHLYQRDAEKVVNAVLEEIVTALVRGDRVELRGFGALNVVTVQRREVRLINWKSLVRSLIPVADYFDPLPSSVPDHARRIV